MASVKFYVHNKKSKKEVPHKDLPIQVSFTYDSKRVITSAGERVLFSNWDTNKQRVKRTAKWSFEINDYLESMSENLMKYYRQSKILGEKISRQKLINIIRNINGDEEEERSVISGLDEFIEVNRSKYAVNTIKKFITLKNHLLIYQKKYRITLEYENIDNSFFDKFNKYFLDNEMTNNSITTNFRRLKWYLNWANDRGINDNLIFRKFKVKETPGEIFTLNWEELHLLYNLKIESESLKKVRDVFCFGCFTGLRYSDIYNLKKTQILDDSISVRVQKTRDTLIIPLNDYSKSILNKYKNLKGEKALPVLSNQKYNSHLKDLGKLAEFNTPVTRYRYSGSKRIEQTMPKYMIITTHMARKTFITNAFRQGIPTEIIMKISNHKSHKVLERYNKISEEQKADAMKKAFSIQQ